MYHKKKGAVYGMVKIITALMTTLTGISLISLFITGFYKISKTMSVVLAPIKK